MIGSTTSTGVQTPIATAVQNGGTSDKINTAQQQPLAKTAQPRQAASAESQNSDNQKKLNEDDGKPKLEPLARKNTDDASATASSRPGQIIDLSV